jgi:hypothetical protein
MKVTVIGNGVSRTPIPLDKISGILIGCNELYLEYCPHYLCAVDIKMLKEIHNSEYPGIVYYRHLSLVETGLKPKKNWHSPEFMQNNSSGNAAIGLAISLGATQIDLLGFDCQQGRVYGPHVPPSNWSLWINNLIYLSKKYPIRRVIGVNSLDIPEIPNEISVENFLKELDK